jgi:ubiquinone/menaquinone biosynthesis C-methylase UbiE
VAGGAKPTETAAVHHPVFARLYTKIADAADRRGATEHRRRLLAGLSGRVVEIGAGDGANFPYYPREVTEVLAVEPESYLRGRALEAAGKVPVEVSVVDGVADRIPAEDGSYDAGVASLVLCSVPDQGHALAELHRVIRPGGELRFYEHVVSTKPLLGALQRGADTLFWPRVAGGCHTSRDTARAIEQAGFEVGSSERFAFTPSLLTPPMPFILGVARRPA